MTFPTFAAGEVLGAADMNAVGLWKIETREVTSASTIDFINVFSTQYRGYKIVWDYLHNTTGGDLQMQYRNAGGPISGNYFFGYGGSYTTSGTPTFGGFSYATTSQTAAFMGTGCLAGQRASGWHDLISPQNTTIVYSQGAGMSNEYTATLKQVYLTGGTFHNTTDTRTGFRLQTSAGTVTGKFTLYGYRN